MSSAIAQLSCFSSVIYNRRLQLNSGSYSRTASFGRGKVLNVMSSDGRGTEVSNLVDKTMPSYIEDSSKLQNGSSTKSDPLTQGFVDGESNGRIQEQVNSQPKRAAKIHDFCFGIPFGGLVLSGGLLGFILSRNPVTLSTGVLFGGALLALSTFSLKVWRQGKSSLPFILGQAAYALA
ncbi:UNVERIFIED_CONTAM: protein FATTY ACID EXPORT 1, chloroplastic [Sesamum latifolium]|uniref:Protein FATTY ACID EXPORT 1, chloroplastic n=1 Tax=Sesamum latifolium TaxID=2727402 RepID=A0AAW2XH79_9LAMI